jgi:large subunit ribosomal protein L4
VSTVTDTAPGYVRRERPEPAKVVVERRSQDGTVLAAVVLPPDVFGIEPNTAVLHQVVTAQLAAARAGTQSTKTRAEVRGGGAKPFKQKGTGRGRQGSIRSPQWVGGGVALGPKPRSYRQRTPKKMIRLALHSALSDRAADGRVVLLDQWAFEVPKTKDAVAFLDTFELDGRVLVVLGEEDAAADRSFNNLPEVQTMLASELNAYDVLRCDWVIFTDETLPGEAQPAPAGATPARASTAKKAAKATKAAKAAKATKATKAAESVDDEAGTADDEAAGEPDDDTVDSGADIAEDADTDGATADADDDEGSEA